MRRTYI